MHKEYELINKAVELFSIKTSDNGRNYYGLLCPPTDESIFHYGKPLYIHLTIEEKTLNDYNTFICIGSYDDSGVSIWGPVETIENATARLNKFIEWIKDDCRTICPRKFELEVKCCELKMYADYW